MYFIQYSTLFDNRRFCFFRSFLTEKNHSGNNEDKDVNTGLRDVRILAREGGGGRGRLFFCFDPSFCTSPSKDTGNICPGPTTRRSLFKFTSPSSSSPTVPSVGRVTSSGSELRSLVSVPLVRWSN